MGLPFIVGIAIAMHGRATPCTRATDTAGPGRIPTARSETRMIRALVKLAVTYALTRALTRAGGPAGVLGAVLGRKGRAARGGAHRGGRRGH